MPPGRLRGGVECAAFCSTLISEAAQSQQKLASAVQSQQKSLSFRLPLNCRHLDLAIVAQNFCAKLSVRSAGKLLLVCPAASAWGQLGVRELSKEVFAVAPGRSSCPRTALWFLWKSNANIWWPPSLIASICGLAEGWADGSFPPTDTFLCILTVQQEGIQITESGKFHISHDGTLSIQDLGVADQGRYECIARNPFGFTSSAMQLTITGSVSPAAPLEPPLALVQAGAVAS